MGWDIVTVFGADCEGQFGQNYVKADVKRLMQFHVSKRKMLQGEEEIDLKHSLASTSKSEKTNIQATATERALPFTGNCKNVAPDISS